MSSQDQISKTQKFVKDYFKNETTGHDYWHMHRTWNTAKKIAEVEGGNLLVIELACLLHDIADEKLGDKQEGMKIIRDWLDEIGVNCHDAEHIDVIIQNVSFNGGIGPNKLDTIEGKIVHDADKLDALGAIGIARAFQYSGSKKRFMHVPGTKVQKYKSAEEYRKSDAPTITHFYEKLFLLKDRMLTKTGKQMAEECHQYMVDFVDQFYKEWGEDH